jgi:RNA polymerase sigma factor (sigma-70 family)
MTMDTSLTWLARLVASTDGLAWERLSEVYTPLLARWAARSGVPPVDRDDVVQEVLIVVVQRVAEFEHQRPGAFRSWLRSILANKLRGYFAKQRNATPGIDFDSLADPHSVLGRQLDAEHNAFVVLRVMSLIEHDFEPRTWLAFRRVVLSGESTADVARDLNMSLNAVVLARGRVMKRMRQEIGAWCE